MVSHRPDLLLSEGHETSCVLQVPEENIQSVIGALRTKSTAQWRQETTKTTVFKVISFKRLSCPKSAKSLLADSWGSALTGRDLTTKRGWRADGVFGMPLLLGHFPSPTLLPLSASTARSGSFSLVYQTEYVSFPLWSCFFPLPDPHEHHTVLVT